MPALRLSYNPADRTWSLRLGDVVIGIYKLSAEGPSCPRSKVHPDAIQPITKGHHNHSKTQ
jgi:hypothetical protein